MCSKKLLSAIKQTGADLLVIMNHFDQSLSQVETDMHGCYFANYVAAEFLAGYCVSNCIALVTIPQ